MQQVRIIGEEEQNPEKTKAQRIRDARDALAKRYEQDPAAVARFNAKMSKLQAAQKRERQRFETRCLGIEPEPLPLPKKPTGMSKSEWRIEKARIITERTAAEAEVRRFLGRAATPQTLARVESAHSDGLEQLERNGSITKDQREHAAQIANVYRSIESETAVKVASFEARIDQSRRFGQIAERIHRVRMHRAYTIWRDLLPAPKGLVMDMIVGDSIGYSVAAKRYRVHNRKAKRELISAIERWPLCVARAFSAIDELMVHDMNRAVAPCWPAEIASPPRAANATYQIARACEAGRDQTDEPYLLPAVDPEFFDERGLLRPFAEIAEIVRHRVFAIAEAA